MRVILKIFLIFIFISIFISCSDNSSKKDLRYNPTTLKELHNGFFDEEIVAEIAKSNNSEITIITTGHLYPLLNYPLAYNAVVDSIINQNPDYVFLLGDLVRDNTDVEWDSVLTRFDKVGCKVYFAPGNHDLNYHYERWEGSREHQYTAEMKYIEKVGYRYKLLKDSVANYVFINPNDSIDRVLSYLEIIKPEIDTSKLMILLSSQSLWHNKHQIKGDNHTWMAKAFTRDDILPNVEYFDYLIHGDWGGKFYEGNWPKSKGRFTVFAVGNRVPGDSLYIAKLVVTGNGIKGSSIRVLIPEESDWFK